MHTETRCVYQHRATCSSHSISIPQIPNRQSSNLKWDFHRKHLEWIRIATPLREETTSLLLRLRHTSEFASRVIEEHVNVYRIVRELIVLHSKTWHDELTQDEIRLMMKSDRAMRRVRSRPHSSNCSFCTCCCKKRKFLVLSSCLDNLQRRTIVHRHDLSCHFSNRPPHRPEQSRNNNSVDTVGGIRTMFYVRQPLNCNAIWSTILALSRGYDDNTRHLEEILRRKEISRLRLCFPFSNSLHFVDSMTRIWTLSVWNAFRL